MEEKYISEGQEPEKFLNEMLQEVEDTGEPVTALVNDVRVVMFPEKKHDVPEYDGPR